MLMVIIKKSKVAVTSILMVLRLLVATKLMVWVKPMLQPLTDMIIQLQVVVDTLMVLPHLFQTIFRLV